MANGRRLKDFTWGNFTFWTEVPETGFSWRYDLHRWQHDTKARPEGNDRGPWLTTYGWDWKPKLGTTIRRRQNELGLHRFFAALPSEEPSILKFANKYGQLGHGAILEDPTVDEGSGNRLMQGDGLKYWQLQIAKMRSITRAWDHVRKQSNKALAPYVHWGPPTGSLRQVDVSLPDWPAWFDLVRSKGVNSRDKTTWPVREAILDHVTDRLRGHVFATLIHTSAGPVIRDVPDCLGSALYASFALEISGISPAAKQCPNFTDPLCPTHNVDGMFVPAGKKEHCSDHCRNKVWRRDHKGGAQNGK